MTSAKEKSLMEGMTKLKNKLDQDIYKCNYCGVFECARKSNTERHIILCKTKQSSAQISDTFQVYKNIAWGEILRDPEFSDNDRLIEILQRIDVFANKIKTRIGVEQMLTLPIVINKEDQNRKKYDRAENFTRSTDQELCEDRTNNLYIDVIVSITTMAPHAKDMSRIRELNCCVPKKLFNPETQYNDIARDEMIKYIQTKCNGDFERRIKNILRQTQKI